MNPPSGNPSDPSARNATMLDAPNEDRLLPAGSVLLDGTAATSTLRNRSGSNGPANGSLSSTSASQPLQRDSFRLEGGAPMLGSGRNGIPTALEDDPGVVVNSPTYQLATGGGWGDSVAPNKRSTLAGKPPGLNEVDTRTPAYSTGVSHSTTATTMGKPPTPSMLRTIVTLAAPISVSQMAQFSIMMFMLAAVGTIGVAEMGGASIGFGLINATAFAFSSGLCGALETLLAQSFGRDPSSKMYGVYTQRMLLILVLFAVPLSLCLAFAEPLLLWMGEPANVASFAGRFCTISAMISVAPVMLLELLRRYYVSQRRPNPVFITVLVTALVNPLVVYPIVHELGYDGVAIAFACITAAMDGVLLIYLYSTGLYKQTWGGWSKEAFQQWGPMLKLALPSLAMGVSEWTSLEANSVVAGLGTEVELAAYAVSSQVASLFWAIPSGVYMSATVLVANSIGAGQPLQGRRYAAVTTCIAVALSGLNCAAVLLFGRQIAAFFTDDEAVIMTFAAKVGPAMAAYHFADTFSCNGLAILRGCGLHAIGMAIILASLAFCGTPLGIVMFTKWNYGVDALWIGPLVGYLVIALPALAYVMFRRIDWRTLKPAEGGESYAAH